MSDPVHFEITLKVNARSEDILAKFCADHLRLIGYNVAPAHAKWESKREFMQRLGIVNHDSVNRDIETWLARGNTLLLDRAPSGKLMELLSNSDFDAFCKRHKSPEKA